MPVADDSTADVLGAIIVIEGSPATEDSNIPMIMAFMAFYLSSEGLPAAQASHDDVLVDVLTSKGVLNSLMLLLSQIQGDSRSR